MIKIKWVKINLNPNYYCVMQREDACHTFHPWLVCCERKSTIPSSMPFWTPLDIPSSASFGQKQFEEEDVKSYSRPQMKEREKHEEPFKLW